MSRIRSPSFETVLVSRRSGTWRSRGIDGHKAGHNIRLIGGRGLYTRALKYIFQLRPPPRQAMYSSQAGNEAEACTTQTRTLW